MKARAAATGPAFFFFHRWPRRIGKLPFSSCIHLLRDKQEIQQAYA